MSPKPRLDRWYVFQARKVRTLWESSTQVSHGGFRYDKPGRLALFVIAALACWLYPASLVAAPSINYVQGNYANPQTPQTTVNVTFTAAQAAGDLNVVVVGWKDSTATVSVVTDTSGNIY